MTRWAKWLLAIHILLWVALAARAYAAAGAYSFASCWQIIPVFIPPIGVLLLAIAGFSVLVLAIAIARPAMRRRRRFAVALHGMVLTAGLIHACSPPMRQPGR